MQVPIRVPTAIAKKIGKAMPLILATLVGLEGYASKPYYDSAGVLTDCFGNTHNVAKGKVRSKLECRALLKTKAFKVAKRIATDDWKHSNAITMGELAAVTSWAYNVGLGAYSNSTLRKYLLKGQYTAMCHEIPRWKYITVAGAKVVLPGLVNRRAKELKICLSG